MAGRGSVERTCEIDGVLFFTTPGRIAQGKGRWCSKRCLGKALFTSVEMFCPVCGKGKFFKPSHITDGQPKYCPEHRPRKVLVRNWDCRLHQPRPRLHVHHLVPRRMFSGDFISANVIENLVTLCRSCHKLREVILDATYHMVDVALVDHPVRGRTVLTMEKAREIRSRYAAGDILQRELAADYDVDTSTISRVVTERDWPEPYTEPLPTGRIIRLTIGNTMKQD